MESVSLNFDKEIGVIRPMHAVNNGPVYKFTEDQRISNIDAFQDAAIPYARTHDSSFYYQYGGEHTVDILAVFPDFSKDADDPASYDFCLTDEYLKVMIYAGVEPFYRLGSKIEHWPKKYGTLPPPDFKKWAVICEHIIAHYTEGWADGFRYHITYWEIWNEPDCADDASYVDKKCWGGTRAQFFEFFETAVKYLKARFPHLKIGGPAVCSPYSEWVTSFLGYCRDREIPLDFFSWHLYANHPRIAEEAERYTRELLDSFGYTATESILNEWNYIKGWHGNDWLYSLRTEKNLKGSSYIAGMMLLSQYQPLDLLMYYDARPCRMNGMFSTDIESDRLKGYYPFWMFNKLYQLGTSIDVICSDKNLMIGAAKGDGGMAFMLTYFDDTEKAEDKHLKISFNGLDGKAYRFSYYKLDAENDAALYRTETVHGICGECYLTLPLFTTILVAIEPAEPYKQKINSGTECHGGTV